MFCSVFFFFLIFQADTSLFLFHLIVENLILHIFLIIMIIIPCSGMFRNVPGCSEMFRDVPRCSMFHVPCSWFYRRLIFSHNYHNYSMFQDVPGCSGMFRNGPGCSMFLVLSTASFVSVMLLTTTAGKKKKFRVEY